MSSTQMRTYLAVASAVLAVFAFVLLSAVGGPRVTTTVGYVGLVYFTAVAALASARASRNAVGPRRCSWRAMTVGLTGWVVGSLIWAYYGVIRNIAPPFPSLADLAYFVLPICVCAAWATQASTSKLTRLRPLLDAIVIAAALFLVSWVAILRTVFAASHASTFELTVAVAFPVSDVIVITLAVLVASSAPVGHRRTVGLVAAGMTVTALADSTHLYLRAHGLPSNSAMFIGWATGALLITAAALISSRTPGAIAVAERPPSRLGISLPYIPLLAAVGAGFLYMWPIHQTRPVIIAAAVLVTVAAVRQLIALIDNRRLFAAVAAQALRDPLTGLANRLLFTDRLHHAMGLRHRDGRAVAILTLDLDDFKLVNDHLGHPSGDALLRAIAVRLMDTVPDGDNVARLGGDEFAILIEGGDELPEAIAQRVAEAFDDPFVLDGEELFMHPSIGLATAPDPEAEDISADELFKRADVAMYAAKRTGVGGVQSFDPEMRLDRVELPESLSDTGKRRRASVAGIRLLGQLRRSIDNGELTLAYQPKVSLTTGGIVGVEALLRWPHPELGMLMPGEFLPLVRQNGLIGAVTDLVLDQAARDAAQWYAAGSCEVPVSINLFAPSLNDTTLPDRIAAVLSGYRLPAGSLMIELTEHFLLSSSRRAAKVIERLRASGVGVSIDDFGTGYATMSYLRDLTIDELKLDQQFVAQILDSPRTAAIVCSVIGLTHALGITSVAEGVEDAATAQRLREFGCEVGQGHYFAEPMFARELRARLAVNERFDTSRLPVVQPFETL